MPQQPPVFLEVQEGLRIILPGDRCSYGIQDVITGFRGENKGNFTEIPDSCLSQFMLGPCLVETMPSSYIQRILKFYGPEQSVMARDLRFPVVYRYTLLDGQRVVLITTCEGINRSLFLQTDRVHDEYPEWRSFFPAFAFE